MDKKYIIALFIIILSIGAFLRFYGIGNESLRLDEGATALAVKIHTMKDLLNNIYTKGQILPEYYNNNLDFPVYYAILKFWSGIFGLSEVSLRSVSAIFGSLSIILVYLVAEELYNANIGIISAFMLALHPILIEYSQEARLYSFIIFVALASGYYLVKFIRSNKNIHLAMYILSNLAGIYTGPIFIFFLVFEALYVMYLSSFDYIRTRKIKIAKIHVSFLIFFAAYLPLAWEFLHPKFLPVHYAGKLSIAKIIKMFFEMSTWLYPSPGLKFKLSTMQLYLLSLSDWMLIASVALIAALLFIFFLKSASKIKIARKNPHIFLIMWIFLPLLTHFIVLYRSISTFGTIVYVIYIIPAYLILISAGIYGLKTKNLIAVLALFSILSIAPLSSYYLNVNYPQYREATAFLEQNTGKGDLIIVNIPSVRVPLDYYSKKLADVYGISNVEEAQEKARNSQSVWLVLSTKYSDPDGMIKKYFDKNYKLVKSKEDLFEISLYHYIR